MIIKLLSLGATTADDLNNPIEISGADTLKLVSLAKSKGINILDSTGLPQMVRDAIVFTDTDWTSGDFSVSIKFQGANGETEVCATATSEITADGLIFLTPVAAFLQNASSEFMMFPLSGPSAELPQVDVTEDTAGALVTLDLYLMVPDY